MVFFLLTFTREVCTPRPTTGYNAIDYGLDFLALEGTGFRVELGLGPLVQHYGRDQDHENSQIIYVEAMVVNCNVK
jgi:hypothetical protein